MKNRDKPAGCSVNSPIIIIDNTNNYSIYIIITRKRRGGGGGESEVGKGRGREGGRQHTDSLI